VRQDAAFEEGVELVLDESRQFGASAGLGVGDETGRVLLHQSVQRGLLRAANAASRSPITCGAASARRSKRNPAATICWTCSNSHGAAAAIGSTPAASAAEVREVAGARNLAFLTRLLDLAFGGW